MENQIATTSPTNITPMEMIMAAVSGQADLDKVEKLLALQERWEANEARKQFAKSFSTAQSNILPVIKKRFNQQTKSKYSELADVIEVSQPIYTDEGFSITFNEGDSPLPEHVRVLADVLHSAGHKESYHFDVPLDGKGIQGNANMTKIHGKASSISYGRRYLMCMIWNIPTADNDGNITNPETITQAQVNTLEDLIKTKSLDKELLLTYLEIDSLGELPSTQYTKALTAINAARKVVK